MELAYTTCEVDETKLVFVSTKEAGRLYEMGDLELSNARLLKAERMKEANSKLQSIAAGLALSKGLELFAGIDEREVTLEYGRYGKPALSKSAVRMLKQPVQFNLSHSGEYGVAAFSQRAVGVDLQRVTPISHRMADRILNDAEHEWLMSVEDDFDQQLLCLFSAKEAVLKAIGIGLGGMAYDYEWDLDALMSAEGEGISFLQVKCKDASAREFLDAFDQEGVCNCRIYRVLDGNPDGYVCFVCECL